MRIAPVPIAELAAIRHLTYPAVYDLVRDRFPSETIAVAAYCEDDPVALAIGVRGPRPQCEILSLFVADLFRRQGIGSALLARLEQCFADEQFETGIHFLTVDPDRQGPARFLMKNGWRRPDVVKLICRSTLEKAFDTPWLVRATLPEHHAIVAWGDLTRHQRSAVRSGVGNWIPVDLAPFGFESGYEPSTSVALLAGRGTEARVAGWVITHVIDRSTLRWTCSFVDPKIQGSARILPLWLEVARRQRNLGGIEDFIFTVPLTQPRMARFAARYMRPWLTGLSYSCMTAKRLSRA